MKNSECIFWTHPCIDSVILDILEDDKKLATNAALAETEYAEATHSEGIWLTPSCIEYIILCLLEDYVKAEVTVALGESADVEEVLRVDIEYDEVSAEGWEYGLGVSNGDLVNTD